MAADRGAAESGDPLTVDDERMEWGDENAVLLRRLDGWKEGDHDTSPLIRWAATHLRGELSMRTIKPESGDRGLAAQCTGYAGDPGASAPRCESYAGHPGGHFIRAALPHGASGDRVAELEAALRRFVEASSVVSNMSSAGSVDLYSALQPLRHAEREARAALSSGLPTTPTPGGEE